MIEYLEIRNFRNHEHLQVQFNSKNTFIEGFNGAGKTSIIEAISYISFLKSFRTPSDELLVKQGKEYFRIILKTNNDLYEVVYNEGRKLLKINKKIIGKMSEFIANLKTIVFSSEDLNLVYGPPAGRRTFMDQIMVQLNKDYLEELSTYKTILKERNALLKNLKEDSDLTFLKIINKRIEKEADKIIIKRTEFIKKLNKAFKTRFKNFNKNDDVEVVYQPNCALNSLESVLNGRFKRDIFLESTSAGPHRDELLIKFNGSLAKDIASQGQVRLITLSLKLALIDLYEKGKDIVILLDDVLSELDEQVVEEIEKVLKLENQIIITGTKNKYKNIQVLNLNKKESQKDEWWFKKDPLWCI